MAGTEGSPAAGRRSVARAMLAVALGVPLAVAAHGEREHAPKAAAPISAEEHPWGREGDPRKATRTVAIDMADTMRFSPARITVRQGDTVRFRVSNSGRQMHELVIGTREELERHAELMRRDPGMEHDEPYMAHVAPGKRATITWTFTQAGTFMYGCLVPGHWDAGMKGTVVVLPRPNSNPTQGVKP